MRRRRVWALAGMALCVWGCAGAPLHERGWLEARTPNFTILSTRSAPETLDLARDLELFRKVVEFTTGESIPSGRLPLRIFALDRSTYRRFAPSGVLGVFVPSPRQNAIVFCVGCISLDERFILQHEYVHFLLRNRGLYAYPPWYDEGFAEFLSSVEVRRDGVDIGRPLRHRIQALVHTGWISVEDLTRTRNLAEQRPEQVAAFYAESWALIHYLNFGRTERRARGDLTRYLRALREGSSNEEAMREGFGASSAALGHRLRRYIAAGRYPYVTVPRERLPVEGEPTLRTPEPLEVAHALGRLSLTLDEPGEAEHHFQAALALRPGDARALGGLATALAAQARWQEAEESQRAALAAAPDDAEVRLDVADALHARARAEQDTALRADLARRAREHYVASWKLDAEVPATYAGYGATWLLEGEDPARGLETLEHAQRLLPGSPEIKMALAELYSRLGRRQQARELALVVATWAHSEQQAEEIRSLLDATGAPGSDGAAR